MGLTRLIEGDVETLAGLAVHVSIVSADVRVCAVNLIGVRR
jgi:hypothetical protein